MSTQRWQRPAAREELWTISRDIVVLRCSGSPCVKNFVPSSGNSVRSVDSGNEVKFQEELI